MALSSKGLILAKEIAKRTRISASSPSLNRKISSGDYDDNGYDKYKHRQIPPESIPNRPLRGERHPTRESARPRRQPSPSRDRLSFDKHFEDSDTASSAADRSKKNDNVQSDQSFLQQFKLGSTQEKPGAEKQQSNKEAKEPIPPPEDADEIFKKMKEKGLIPNAVAMLDGLCKDGLVQEAMKLFGLMREKGTIPEVVIYTAVVEGFCKAHKFDDAKRIFRKMQSNGISPNAISYTVMIQGLYKCNEVDDALEFSVEMLENGHSPNVATFVGLVDALCTEKGVEEAQRGIDMLRQKGFVVDEKAVKEFMGKKTPFPSMAWEAIYKKKRMHIPF